MKKNSLAEVKEIKDKTRNMNEQTEMHARKEEKKMKEAATLTLELKRIDEKVTLYEHGDYRVCVIETDDMFKAWLAHKDNRYALRIFGCLKVKLNRPDKPLSLDEFLETVTNSLGKLEWIYFDETGDMGHP